MYVGTTEWQCHHFSVATAGDHALDGSAMPCTRHAKPDTPSSCTPWYPSFRWSPCAECSAALVWQARHIRQAWDVICEKTSELLGTEALANGINGHA